MSQSKNIFLLIELLSGIGTCFSLFYPCPSWVSLYGYFPILVELISLFHAPVLLIILCILVPVWSLVLCPIYLVTGCFVPCVILIKIISIVKLRLLCSPCLYEPWQLSNFNLNFEHHNNLYVYCPNTVLIELSCCHSLLNLNIHPSFPWCIYERQCLIEGETEIVFSVTLYFRVS